MYLSEQLLKSKNTKTYLLVTSGKTLISNSLRLYCNTYEKLCKFITKLSVYIQYKCYRVVSPDYNTSADPCNHLANTYK